MSPAASQQSHGITCSPPRRLKHYGPTAPLADRHKHVSSASMQKFVVTNQAAAQCQGVQPHQRQQYKEAISHAQKLIHDPAKGYKVAGYGEKGKQPQGDNRTIVINENNKTAHAPASQMSGPDRRTIIVNCNNCKVVIVGDTAKNGQQVVDQRNIIVNGKNDKIVLQGDKASGANGTGQSGGTIKDERHVTVNGDKNVISRRKQRQGQQRRGRGQMAATAARSPIPAPSTSPRPATRTRCWAAITSDGRPQRQGRWRQRRHRRRPHRQNVNDEGNKNKADTARNDTEVLN